MDYQNLRGGSIVLNDIEKPPKQQWSNVLEAVEDALALEKDVNKVSKHIQIQDKCWYRDAISIHFSNILYILMLYLQPNLFTETTGSTR